MGRSTRTDGEYHQRGAERQPCPLLHRIGVNRFLWHESRDSAFADEETELEQLGVNPWRAPADAGRHFR